MCSSLLLLFYVLEVVSRPQRGGGQSPQVLERGDGDTPFADWRWWSASASYHDVKWAQELWG